MNDDEKLDIVIKKYKSYIESDQSQIDQNLFYQDLAHRHYAGVNRENMDQQYNPNYIPTYTHWHEYFLISLGLVGMLSLIYLVGYTLYKVIFA